LINIEVLTSQCKRGTHFGFLSRCIIDVKVLRDAALISCKVIIAGFFM
jgi:hypothetical protein